MKRQISQPLNISNIQMTQANIIANISSPKSMFKKSRQHADILENIMGRQWYDQDYSPQYDQFYNKGSTDLIRANQDSIIAKIDGFDEDPIRASYKKPGMHPIRQQDNMALQKNQFIQRTMPNNQFKQQKFPIQNKLDSQKPSKQVVQSVFPNNNSVNNQDNSHVPNRGAAQIYKKQQINNKLLSHRQSIGDNQNNYPACWFFLEVLIAYTLTIVFCYLSQVHVFPMFEIVMTFSLLLLIQTDIKQLLFTQGLYFLVLIIIIANNYLQVTLLSYLQILVCYISVALFSEVKQNQTFFKKLSAVIIIAMQIIFGFLIVPNLYARLKQINAQEGFYYIYPFFSIILRSIVNLLFYHISYSSITWNQLPLFLTGLDIGIILTLNTAKAQFWYLMVYLTLTIIEQRRYFVATLLIRCIQHIKKQEFGSKKLLKQISVYGTLTWFHIIILIYLFGYLPIYTSPYNSNLTLSLYVADQYTPLVVWSLGLFYQFIALKLHYRNNYEIFYKKKQPTALAQICVTISRGIIVCFGLWLFYLGLGIGNYMVVSNQAN